MKWTPIFFQNDFNGHNVLIYFVTIFKSNFYKTLNLDFQSFFLYIFIKIRLEKYKLNLVLY